MLAARGYPDVLISIYSGKALLLVGFGDSMLGEGGGESHLFFFAFSG